MDSGNQGVQKERKGPHRDVLSSAAAWGGTTAVSEQASGCLPVGSASDDYLLFCSAGRERSRGLGVKENHCVDWFRQLASQRPLASGRCAQG